MPNMPSQAKSAANRFEPATAAEKAEFDQRKAVANQARPVESDDEGGEPTETTTVTYVTGVVAMSTSTTASFDVPEWELDVLQEIHGAEAVKVTGQHDVEYPYSAAQAFQYMKNKYKTREGEDLINRVYRRLKDFAKSTGLPYRAGDEGGSAQQASMVIIHDTGSAAKAQTKQGAAGSGAGGKAAA